MYDVERTVRSEPTRRMTLLTARYLFLSGLVILVATYVWLALAGRH